MSATRRPTMADVAARAGVSLSTVSLTYSGAGPISPDMRARVEKAAAELDYAALVDAATLEPAERVGGSQRLLVAARFGATRLLDNVAVDPAA